MRIFPIAFLAILGLVRVQAAVEIAGDSARGEKLFTTEQCIQCHSINGKGGLVGPDLGRIIDRGFSPAGLAGLMWNHAPAMWEAMEKRGVQRASLSPESAADLFAYFYSVRFFDKPGDAGRGRAIFTSRKCGDCHGIAEPKEPGAPPVTSWESLGHPIVLARQMWNHSAKMGDALAKRKIKWQQLTTQDLSDVLVYLRNLPDTKQMQSRFDLEPAPGGKEVFEAKGCAKCHTGARALENRLHNQTLTDIAVDMWNHAPKMAKPTPELSPDEMRRLVSYLWVQQFFRSGGSAAKGQKLFTDKHCSSCHGVAGTGAPNLKEQAGNFSAVSMISALWRHGPRMLNTMQQKKIAWPRWDGNQMADMIAFLNTR
jgi:mono/diheme cytochrome c family protein